MGFRDIPLLLSRLLPISHGQTSLCGLSITSPLLHRNPVLFDDLCLRALPVLPILIGRLVEHERFEAATKVLTSHAPLLTYHPSKLYLVRDLLAYYHGAMPPKLVRGVPFARLSWGGKKQDRPALTLALRSVGSHWEQRYPVLDRSVKRPLLAITWRRCVCLDRFQTDGSAEPSPQSS